MRTIRVAVMPLICLAAVCCLAFLQLEIPQIAHFSFIWDVLLGAFLGALLALTPKLAGFPSKNNAAASLFWICGFASLLLVFYQYMTLVTGLQLDTLAFLSEPSVRMRIVEGAMLGYCSCIAGRGKL